MRIVESEGALARAGLSERPVAVLDLDAFDANLEDLARRAAGTPIRLASKSLRVRSLLERALSRPAFSGILAYTLPEALWLVGHGLGDIVVAYPTVDRGALRQLVTAPKVAGSITLMVDETSQLDLILDATADLRSRAGARIRVAIELDVSYSPLPGLRFGAYRSPVRGPQKAVSLAREIAARPALELVGLMAYEGHIAGVTDSSSTPYGVAVRAMKALSRPDVAARRTEAVAAVARGRRPRIRQRRGHRFDRVHRRRARGHRDRGRVRADRPRPLRRISRFPPAARPAPRIPRGAPPGTGRGDPARGRLDRERRPRSRTGCPRSPPRAGSPSLRRRRPGRCRPPCSDPLPMISGSGTRSGCVMRKSGRARGACEFWYFTHPRCGGRGGPDHRGLRRRHLPRRGAGLPMTAPACTRPEPLVALQHRQS